MNKSYRMVSLTNQFFNLRINIASKYFMKKYAGELSKSSKLNTGLFEHLTRKAAG